jgi:valyl-tRNA synthetase
MATKENSRQIKSSEAIEVNESPVPVEDKIHEPTESEIRELAEVIYHERILRGEYGTPEEDWLKAESHLRDMDISWF